MEIIKANWYTTMSKKCTGIIKARDILTNEIHYYIGVGDGESEEADIAKIIAYGTKLTESELMSTL